MIHLLSGNIFNSGAEALVNPVNCVGVMGKGLALQFAHEYPRESGKYKKWAKLGNMVPGVPFWVATDDTRFPSYIVHFPTKVHWRDKSILVDVANGLIELRRELLRLEVKSIAIPPLGCGLGGLDWQEVYKRINSTFKDVDATIYVYAP